MPKVKLTFPNDKRGYYVVSDFTGRQTTKQMKDEYTRMRDIARKRINRLEKSGIYPQREIERMRKKFPKISELDKSNMDKELKKYLGEVSYLLNKEGTTANEARRRAKDYHDSMVDVITSNFPDVSEELLQDVDGFTFWEFVEWTKENVRDGALYWTESQVKYLFDTKALVKASQNYEADNSNFQAIAEKIRGYAEIQGKKERT